MDPQVMLIFPNVIAPLITIVIVVRFGISVFVEVFLSWNQNDFLFLLYL